MKKAITILLVFVLCIATLCACGGGTGLTGKYSIVSVTEGGQTIELAQLSEVGIDPAGFFIEFIDGAKYNMAVFGESQEGTYKLEGKTLALTALGETAQATVDGSKITIDMEGTVMVFEKK